MTGDPATATSHAYLVGEIEIIPVSDGERTAPVAEGFVLNAPLDEVKRAYATCGFPEGHGTMPFNPTVIRTGGQTALVDTGIGAGAAAQPDATAGFLMRNLAFDQDPVAAESTRRRTLAWLAREQLPVQGFHFPFLGRAFVEAAGDGYRAVAITGAG